MTDTPRGGQCSGVILIVARSNEVGAAGRREESIFLFCSPDSDSTPARMENINKTDSGLSASASRQVQS